MQEKNNMTEKQQDKLFFTGILFLLIFSVFISIMAGLTIYKMY